MKNFQIIISFTAPDEFKIEDAKNAVKHAMDIIKDKGVIPDGHKYPVDIVIGRVG